MLKIFVKLLLFSSEAVVIMLYCNSNMTVVFRINEKAHYEALMS